jgi:starch phosphorylase
MKTSIGTLCHFVNTHRMVSEYTCRFYMKAHEQFRSLEADGSARGRALAGWIKHVEQSWAQVRIEAVDGDPTDTLPVGTNIRAQARVSLGGLAPSDVAVELYVGRLDPGGEIVDASTIEMKPAGRDSAGRYMFEAAGVPCSKSGLHGYTVRVLPHHPDLVSPLMPGLIAWAEPQKSGAAFA